MFFFNEIIPLQTWQVILKKKIKPKQILLTHMLLFISSFRNLWWKSGSGELRIFNSWWQQFLFPWVICHTLNVTLQMLKTEENTNYLSQKGIMVHVCHIFVPMVCESSAAHWSCWILVWLSVLMLCVAGVAAYCFRITKGAVTCSDYLKSQLIKRMAAKSSIQTKKGASRQMGMKVFSWEFVRQRNTGQKLKDLVLSEAFLE